jgi:hypothetical protein
MSRGCEDCPLYKECLAQINIIERINNELIEPRRQKVSDHLTDAETIKDEILESMRRSIGGLSGSLEAYQDVEALLEKDMPVGLKGDFQAVQSDNAANLEGFRQNIDSNLDQLNMVKDLGAMQPNDYIPTDILERIGGLLTRACAKGPGKHRKYWLIGRETLGCRSRLRQEITDILRVYPYPTELAEKLDPRPETLETKKS